MLKRNRIKVSAARIQKETPGCYRHGQPGENLCHPCWGEKNEYLSLSTIEKFIEFICFLMSGVCNDDVALN